MLVGKGRWVARSVGSAPMARDPSAVDSRRHVRPRHEAAIVLVHGYLCLSRTAYWRGLVPLRRELAARGWPVITGCVPRTGSVAVRARRLATVLDRLPHRRLVLVGHSMGGLDARFAASCLDPARRIRHVVTLGTPHRGTVMAEWALREPEWLSRLVRFVDRGALHDLTIEGAQRLNAMMPDRPDVTYVSVAGDYPVEQLSGSLRRFGEQVARDEGPNDGMVSLQSAMRWPRTVVVRGHHMNLIGQGGSEHALGSEAAVFSPPVVELRKVLNRLVPPGAAPLEPAGF